VAGGLVIPRNIPAKVVKSRMRQARNFASPTAVKALARSFCAATAVLLSAIAGAAEIEGLKLPERITLGANGPELVLNGAGVRTQAVFKVYVAALYLPAKTDDSEKILRDNRASRLSLHMLRKLTADQITSSINTALRATLTPEERTPLESRLQEFSAMLERLPELNKGTQIAIDYVPESGTTIHLDGAEIGRFPGADFNHALLRVWIGERPRDVRLKKAMLGIPS
jgi:hypothetical protein